MARARLLKPGFFANETLTEMSPFGRLLFAGLWTVADRDGRLPDRPKWIKGALFPYENVPIERLLSQLEKLGFIIRYEAERQHYIQVTNFKKHQHVHVNEAPSTIPAPDEHRTALSNVETNPSASTSTTEAEAKAATTSTSARGKDAPFTGEELQQWRQDMPLAHRLYEDLFGAGRINHLIKPELDEVQDGWEPECITHCFQEAARANAKGFQLVRKILDDHKRDGCFAGRPVTNGANGQRRRPAGANDERPSDAARRLGIGGR